MTLRRLPDAPTAKALVQVELPISTIIANVFAVPCLQVTQPITRHIDERRDAAAQDARRNEDDPDLTRIYQLLDRP